MRYDYNPPVGYRSEKAAQIAAYFITKLGGTADKLALSKLMYITERTSIKQRNRPMFYDEYFSLKDGPICSAALNCINGLIDGNIWSRYIKLRDNKKVMTAPEAIIEFDQLSNSDIRILDAVIEEHGAKSGRQLRDWTHNKVNCPEYNELSGSGRTPITIENIAKAVGAAHPKAISDELKSYRVMAGVIL